MEVTLLHVDDCPNWQAVAEHLAILEGEIPGTVVTHRLVHDLEEAERLGFRGSPTIVVDGVDMFEDEGMPFGLACRLYATPSGLAGSPSLGQLREALLSARS